MPNYDINYGSIKNMLSSVFTDTMVNPPIGQRHNIGETPTASQEALQAPSIDPTFLAAGGFVGGMDNMFGAMMDNTVTKEAIASLADSTSSLSPMLKGILEDIAKKHSTLIGAFGKGAANTMGKGAVAQEAFSGLPASMSKAGGLPIGHKATDALDMFLDNIYYGRGVL